MAKSKRSGRETVIQAQQARRFASDPIFKRCPSCGSQMEGRHQNYQYKECGLNNVVLIGVLVFHCSCGEIAVQLPGIAMLHRFIALELLKKSTLLSGDEVKFLRKHVGYSATELAEILGSTKVSMSRWETGAASISKNADRLLRLAFFMAMMEQYAREESGHEGTLVPELVAFAKQMNSLNLSAFLKVIKDVHEQSQIKIDPNRLGECATPDSDSYTAEPLLVN